MATDYSASETHDSKQVQEMYCEECEKHEDKYTSADGFCLDCVEYKCADCLKYHRRHFKNHTVKDNDNMPQDFYFEKCLAHPKELIKFYCRKCDKSACQECKDSNHQNCQDVAHLPTLVKDMTSSTDLELKELKENLDKLSNKIKDADHELDNKCATIDAVESEAKATIKEHKAKLIETYEQKQKEIIDKFDKEMQETILKLKKERKDLVKKLSDNQSKFKVKISLEEQSVVKAVEHLNVEFKTLKGDYLTLVDDLKKLSSDLEQAQALGQNCKLFLTMKLTRTKCEKLSQNMQEIQHNYIHHCKVKPKLDSEPSIQSLDTTRSFFFTNHYINMPFREGLLDFIQTKASIFRHISSLCLLNEITLLATDYECCSLDIFKITEENSRFYNTIKMALRPWDIKNVHHNKVAVTFPNDE